jgi:hypothetical protein
MIHVMFCNTTNVTIVQNADIFEQVYEVLPDGAVRTKTCRRDLVINNKKG